MVANLIEEQGREWLALYSQIRALLQQFGKEDDSSGEKDYWTPRTMVDFAAWGHNVGCCLQFDRRFSPLLLRPLLRSKL